MVRQPIKRSIVYAFLCFVPDCRLSEPLLNSFPFVFLDQTATGSSENKGKETSNRSKWLIVSIATGLVAAFISLALTMSIWCRRRKQQLYQRQRGHVIGD